MFFLLKFLPRHWGLFLSDVSLCTPPPRDFSFPPPRSDVASFFRQALFEQGAGLFPFPLFWWSAIFRALSRVVFLPRRSPSRGFSSSFFRPPVPFSVSSSCDCRRDFYGWLLSLFVFFRRLLPLPFGFPLSPVSGVHCCRDSLCHFFWHVLVPPLRKTLSPWTFFSRSILQGLGARFYGFSVAGLPPFSIIPRRGGPGRGTIFPLWLLFFPFKDVFLGNLFL